MNWKPITDGDQKVDEVQFRVIPKFAPANAQSELYIQYSLYGTGCDCKERRWNLSATFYNLGKGKAVELYGYWLKSDLTTLYDSGRNTGLTKLDEFHKNQAKIEQENTGHACLELDLASLHYCTLASCSLGSTTGSKK